MTDGGCSRVDARVRQAGDRRARRSRDDRRYDGFWFGFIRNHVNGSVSLTGNTLADPDGDEVVTNTIDGSLSCAANSPAPQVGDSEGGANVVTGTATGQCAGL